MQYSRLIINPSKTKLLSLGTLTSERESLTVIRSIGSGFYRTTDEMSKLKKQDLSDEQVNDILRKAESEKDDEESHLGELSTPVESGANVNKANKKIRKMVPKDIEKFE